MLIENPEQYIGSNIRIRSHGRNQHFGRGRLVGVEGRHAIVQPFQRHRQLERVPLEDVYTWAAGNPQFMQTPLKISSRTSVANEDLAVEGPWVVADVVNAKFFVSTWAGFKPELNRAKIYKNLRGANHCAGTVRKSRAEDIGEVRVLSVQEAQRFLQERFHPAVVAPVAPQPPAEPLQPVAPPFDLTAANPEDLRQAADILHRMAEAEAMHREASAELQKVRIEWRQLEQKIAHPAYGVTA